MFAGIWVNFEQILLYNHHDFREKLSQKSPGSPGQNPRGTGIQKTSSPRGSPGAESPGSSPSLQYLKYFEYFDASNANFKNNPEIILKEIQILGKTFKMAAYNKICFLSYL